MLQVYQINSNMKILLVILSALLVGCLATTQVRHTSYQSTEHLDQKLKQIREEQRKLEETERRLQKAIADTEEKIEAAPPRPVYAPAPPPPKATSIPNEPAGSGSPFDEVKLPTLRPVIKNLPDRSSVVGQLYEANAVFAIPTTANVKDEIRAQLIIDPVKTLEELKKDVTVGPIKSAEKVSISRIVIAVLEAPDFNILSATAAEQAIAETQSTEWLWTLRPKTAGLHPVNIEVYAEVTVGSKTTKHKIRTFDKQVMVEIKPTQALANWWSKYWQWVFVTLLIPFGKWLYDKKFNKPKEKATEVA